METTHVRNLVLGAGAMGAATAYHLARRGQPVCLIEQFAIGHGRGSSHGAARITRHSYADVQYARLMPEAFRTWKTLEADSGQNIYLRTGGISLCPSGADYVAKVTASLEDVGVAHRRMSGRKVRRTYPVFGVPNDADAVFEPDAGMLAAAKAVRIQVELARQFGSGKTQVVENRPVLRIDLESEKPTLITNAGKFVADRLIVTAGPWTKRLVPAWPIPLQPTRQQVLYFRPPDLSPFLPGRFPVFIVKGVGEWNDFYGMPAFEGLGVKVARHGGPDLDPDFPEPPIGDDYVEAIRNFLRGWIPSLADVSIDLTENCIYTVSPNEQFHLGLLPGRGDVYVASTCSGHGFKFSCLVGRILADLATDGETAAPIETWQESLNT